MFKSILLPLDLGDEAEAKRLFTAANDMARTMGAKLHVLTVIPTFSMPMVASFFPADYEKKALAQGYDALAAFVAGQGGAENVANQIVGHGSVYKEIVKAAEETKSDAIILGPGSAESGDYLLGHNAARVMRHATCSVVLLRS